MYHHAPYPPYGVPHYYHLPHGYPMPPHEHMYIPPPPPPGERPGPGVPPPPPGHVYYPVIDPGLQEPPRTGTSSEHERFGPPPTAGPPASGASGSRSFKDGSGLNPPEEVRKE